MASRKSTNYSCDTIPEPQHLAIGSRQRSLSPAIDNLHINTDDLQSAAFDVPTQEEILSQFPPAQPVSVDPLAQLDMERDEGPPGAAGLNTSGRERKLCVRHLRMADEGTFSKLQQSLEALSLTDRQAVNTIWSTFSSSSHPRRATILQGILTMCCFSQLSYLTEQLHSLIRLDPFGVLPKEVSLKILGYLDAFSLCRASQVNRAWAILANDDVVWRDICRQHIGHTCTKCGWGLPVLENKRRPSGLPSPSSEPKSLPVRSTSSPKREMEAPSLVARPAKRQKSETMLEAPTSISDAIPRDLPSRPLSTAAKMPAAGCSTRPWKSVYCERLTVERNWRRGRCVVKTLKGHTDGVMCMQYSDNLSHPSFPVLITGSYDRTARVWNLDTGKEIRVLHGHGRAVRALQFDEAKLVTGSMDRTLKVWNWRTGACIRTLEGHSDGIVCLNFDSNVLASGSVDTTIKIWNFRNGECFTLRGHHDWVNSLQLWSDPARTPIPAHSTDNLMDITEPRQPDIDPGKMLFSASDDGTIKLWDLTLRTCVRSFTGHVGQVQAIKLAPAECDRERERPPMSAVSPPSPETFANLLSKMDQEDSLIDDPLTLAPKQSPGTVLFSGSLDNTIKVWDIASGKSTNTMFGHIEGVWSIAYDRLRIVSGSHDRTIKVWNREDGKCVTTLVGHRAAVTCLALGDDKIVSGSDDGDIRVWSFAPSPPQLVL